MLTRKFVFYLFFVGWRQISFGISIDFEAPNIELHLPFCFIKIGYEIKGKKWGKWHKGFIHYCERLKYPSNKTINMKALCDNCKKEYEAEEDDVFQDINTNTQAKDVRLCPDCMKDLEDIF